MATQPKPPPVTLNDGRTMPQLGLGVWQVKNEEATDVVLEAIDCGYRAIDTAAIYGNEEGVGRALARTTLARSDLFITTKLWNDRHDDVAAALHESLDRLGLAYVDLYLIHWPAPQKGQFVAAWQQLIELRQRGLALSIGVSNFTRDHLTRIIAETGVTPAVNQIELHPTFQQRELRAFHAEKGIATEAWSPLGQGDDLNQPLIVDLAKKYDKTPAQIVLRWHIQNQLIVIPKSATLIRLRENIAVFDFELCDDDMTALAELDTKVRMGFNPDHFG